MSVVSYTVSRYGRCRHKQNVSDCVRSMVPSDRDMWRWNAKDGELVIVTLSQKGQRNVSHHHYCGFLTTSFFMRHAGFDGLSIGQKPSVTAYCLLASLQDALDETYLRIYKRF